MDSPLYSHGDTSDGSSSGASDTAQRAASRLAKRKSRKPPAPAKKPKCTYYARKDEIGDLQDQVELLQEKLRKLQGPVRAPAVSADVLHQHTLLDRSVAASDLALAVTQSMLSSHAVATSQGRAKIPLSTYIHLPSGPDKRNAILSGMYACKLQDAGQFLAARTSALDLRIAQVQTDQFSLPNGAAVVSGLDVTQFDRGHSLRQVYDAFIHFINNQEITVSEKLGVVTIRESDEDVDAFKFSQIRFLTTLPEGVEVEANTVMFATCVDASENAPGCALAAVDFVDHDDLYPQRSTECAHKEIAAAIMLSEIPSSVAGNPPTIAMARWSYTRTSLPEMALPKVLAAAVRSRLSMWCDVIPSSMRERLTVVPPFQ